MKATSVRPFSRFKLAHGLATELTAVRGPIVLSFPIWVARFLLGLADLVQVPLEFITWKQKYPAVSKWGLWWHTVKKTDEIIRLKREVGVCFKWKYDGSVKLNANVLKCFNEPFSSVFLFLLFLFLPSFLRVSQFLSFSFLPQEKRVFDEMIKMKGGNIFFFFGCTLEIVANRERDETWNVKLLSIVEIELRSDALGEPKDLIEWEKYFADLNIGWKFLFRYSFYSIFVHVLADLQLDHCKVL